METNFTMKNCAKLGIFGKFREFLISRTRSSGKISRVFNFPIFSLKIREIREIKDSRNFYDVSPQFKVSQPTIKISIVIIFDGLSEVDNYEL